jgi:hypothetical protein
MSEWVHLEHREIHDFLLHWGRWLRTRKIQGHCASIEHRYKSPQCWDERNPRPEEPDLSKACLIEKQMRIVPKNSRKLLKLKYVLRCDKEFIIKRLRPKDYDQSLYTARQIIKNLCWAQLAPTLKGRFHDSSLSGFLPSLPA